MTGFAEQPRTFSVAPVLAFRRSTPDHMPALDSYAAALRRVLGGTWALVEVQAPWTVVSQRELLEGNPMAAERIIAALDQAASASTVVLDLRPPRELIGIDIPPRGLSLIGETLQQWIAGKGEDCAQVLVVVPNLLEPDAYQSRVIAQLVGAGQVTVVAATGQAWISPPDGGAGAQRLVDLDWGDSRSRDLEPPTLVAVADEGLQSDLEPDDTSLVDLVRRKTIRRFGYFPRPNNGEVNRYFFDGQLCDDELRVLIAEFLADLPDPLVVHDLGVSRWLQKPLTAGTIDAGAKTRSLADVSRMPSRSKRQASVVVVVVPLVQTGESLSRALRVVRSKYPKAVLLAFTVYSQVSVDGPRRLSTFEQQFDTTSGDRETVPVAFVSSVEQSIVDHGGMLPNVAYYAQRPDLFTQERFLSLTADDFWTMTMELERPFKAEDNAPSEVRESLDRVPDFPELLERNGPWLTWKLWVACRELAGVDLSEVTLLTIADELGANALSDNLGLMFGNRPIRVPREAIAGWQKAQGRPTLASWAKDGHDWAAELQERPGSDAVILDEFAFSGETLRGLAGLAAQAGLSVRFIGALATFGRAKTSEVLSGRTSFFLYETEVLRRKVG